MAFSVYPDRLDAMFDISSDKTFVCYDILAICEFSGDKSRGEGISSRAVFYRGDAGIFCWEVAGRRDDGR